MTVAPVERWGVGEVEGGEEREKEKEKGRKKVSFFF